MAETKQVALWIRHTIALTDSDPFLCEDCRNPTDMGLKCRACYAEWKRKLWADIPDRHAELLQASKRLSKLPDATKRAVAFHANGYTNLPLSGEAAEVLAVVKRVLAGPFSDSMERMCEAIRVKDSTDEKGARRSSRDEVNS
jgi:hypothetical protein